MSLNELIDFVGNLPLFEAEILLAGVPDPAAVRVQLSRWVKAGKLIQLRRGLYALSERYRKTEIYEPYLASTLVKPSYLSLEKALEYHSLIPEAVPTFTSVTTERPGRFTTSMGVFDYRHIQTSLFWGYQPISVNKQTAFMAFPEKAILDLFYIRKPKVSSDYLEEMRFQNLSQLRLKKLLEYAARFKKKGILRDAKLMEQYSRSHKTVRKLL